LQRIFCNLKISLLCFRLCGLQALHLNNQKETEAAGEEAEKDGEEAEIN